MSSSKLLDIFAEYQKNMHREIGALMGAVLAATPSNGPSPIIPSLAYDGLQDRILAAVDARLKEFEEKMTLMQTPVRVGSKRGRSPSVCSSDGEEEAPLAPVKAVMPVALAVAVDNVAVASLTEKLNAIQVEEKPVEAVKEEKQSVPADVKAVEVKAPAKVESQLKVEVVKEDTADDSERQSDAADEEEEDELTEIVYKGKKYYMDGEYNIYGLDAEGELVEDPVGHYDEKTRRIVFN